MSRAGRREKSCLSGLCESLSGLVVELSGWRGAEGRGARVDKAGRAVNGQKC